MARAADQATLFYSFGLFEILLVTRHVGRQLEALAAIDADERARRDRIWDGSGFRVRRRGDGLREAVAAWRLLLGD